MFQLFLHSQGGTEVSKESHSEGSVCDELFIYFSQCKLEVIEIQNESVDCNRLAQDEHKWRALVKAVMRFRVL